MQQYVNLIKAVTWLLLLFFVGYAYKSCQSNKIKNQEQTNLYKQYEQQIIQTDSAINRIPFAYSDSERTNFLQNYRTYR